ncbi:MAG: hypothetical protein V3573_13215 [Desulfovibrionaceae bacterium]
MVKDYLRITADWLDEQAKAVRELERKARVVIEEQGDQAGYERLMRDKAELLAGLAEHGTVLLEDVGDEADPLLERLEKFSASALNALKVGSVFYMSALLYPEDHRPGQDNDLEAFAGHVRSLAK